MFYLDQSLVKGCEIVGATSKFQMTPEIEKLLPTKAKEVKNPVREKVLRREKNGEVIYFQEYKRMRQRICYVVLIKELNEAVLPAAVIFFIHEKTYTGGLHCFGNT